jgi:protein arginine kinase
MTEKKPEKTAGGFPSVFREMMAQPGEWLRGEGPDSEIVVSSRVRLARNLQKFRFISRMDAEERTDCEEHLRRAICETAGCERQVYLPLHEVSPLERKFLVERHLVSREHEAGQHPRGVLIGNRESVAIMTNEEDHVRLQVLQSGFQLQKTYAQAEQIDGALEERLDYAFSPQLGYLTACPTNVGTGMRVSVMLHLPGLVQTRHIEKVFQAVAKINLAVRGLYGEGTEATGHFYQISNQVTMGRTESEIVQNVEDVIPTIVRYERKAREALMTKDRHRLEDRIWRAYGMLKYVRILCSDEAIMLISLLRMGVQMGLLKNIGLQDVNELFIYTQPAHLQLLTGKELEPAERDVKRAEFVRTRLATQESKP